MKSIVAEKRDLKAKRCWLVYVDGTLLKNITGNPRWFETEEQALEAGRR